MDPICLYPVRPAVKTGAGASRFWGTPDMPAGTGYPVYVDDNGDEFPYFFICQINLEEVAPYDTENLLPHKGLLSFFAKIGHYIGYYDCSECIGGTVSAGDAVKVMYFPSCEGLEPAPPPDIGRDFDVPGELRIGFARGNPGHFDGHALFAPPLHRPWETWDPPFEDWRILLQVDSFDGEDFSLDFMDMGVLDFLISPDALQRHDFNDVRAIVLSS